MSVAIPVDQSQDAPPDAVGADACDVAQPARLRDGELSLIERNYSLWMHLSLFATALVIPPTGCVAPIILWLIRREKSAFIDDHGRELANVVITGAVASLVLWFIPVVGWIPLWTWYVVTGINAVRGARAANRGEFFRYPMVVRVLS